MAEQSIPTSFIPHDSGMVAPTKRRSAGGLTDLLLLCAIVLFVASTALAIAVFLYQQFLNTESASKLEQLQRAKAAFDPALIQQFTRLDDRMHFGEQLIGAHIAPTAFFHALEQATLQTVSFTTLNFDGSDPAHLAIKMGGLAQSVNSIALQADLFSKSGVVTSPIFSDIARQSDGVHFGLTALVNPAAINYANLLRGANGSLQQVVQPQQTEPASVFGAPQQGQPQSSDGQHSSAN